MAKIHSSLLFLVVLTFLAINFVHTTSISCTFESDQCGWHSVGKGKFKWKRGSGLTEDRTSGPRNDHTCANYKGNYMLIAGGDAESKKDEAVLESQPFTVHNDTIFTFWYAMNGYGTGTLTLSIIAGKSSTDVWKKVGRQGKDWIQDNVNLNPGTIKLQFKSTVRLPVGSDLAIDDIHLLSESHEEGKNKTHCQTTTTESTTTSTTTTTTPTTTTPTTTTEEQKNKTRKFSSLSTFGTSYPSSSSSSCSKFVGMTEILAGTCDFEHDTCGNKININKENTGVKWERTDKMDGNTYQEDSIPGDHTFETNGTRGKYLVFRNAWSFYNSKLISSVETPAIYATYACVSFWYTVPSNYSNLKVSIRDYTGRMTTIWEVDNYIQSKRASNLTGWHEQTLSAFEDPPFTVVFQAYNNYHMAKVGLDDIQIVGANISTGKTRPVSDKTTPVVSVTPGTTTTTEFSTPTKQDATSTTEKQASSSWGTGSTASISQRTKTAASMQTKKPDKIITNISTEKVDKKTSVKPTKNPIKISNKGSDTEKQSGKNTYGHTSTIIGALVGALFVLILVAVIVYTIVDKKNRPKAIRPTQDKMVKKHHQNSNGKLSNVGLHSEMYLNVQVSDGKPESNGSVNNAYEQSAISCLNPVHSISEKLKQVNGNVDPTNDLPVLTSENTETFARL